MVHPSANDDTMGKKHLWPQPSMVASELLFLDLTVIVSLFLLLFGYHYNFWNPEN